MAQAKDWDAKRYMRFLTERTQPAYDLIARIPDNAQVQTVVDLGCGTANSTAVVAERWPKAQIVGVDSSPSMLAEARAKYPQWTFIEADIAKFQATEPVDVIFSNAVFHWLPNHDQVFPKVLQSLKPGGVLAVQMPRNFDAPSHRMLHIAAAEEPWRAKLESVRLAREISPVHLPSYYYDVLAPIVSKIHLWETDYVQQVDSAADVADFVRTTGARPFLDPLSSEEQGSFLARYVELLKQHYKPQSNGKVLFTFKRLFFVAIR